MSKVIGTLIAGAIAILLFPLFIKIWDRLENKKTRKEQLYFAENRLHKMALQFRDNCMEETKNLIAKYTVVLDRKSYRHSPDYITYSFLSDYRRKIDSMKEDYLVNYSKIYSEGDNWLRCEAEDLPRHILDEYESEISHISNTFREICSCMEDQLRELKER